MEEEVKINPKTGLPYKSNQGLRPEHITPEMREDLSRRAGLGGSSIRKQITVEKNKEKRMKRFLKNFEKHNGMKYAACSASKMTYNTYLGYRKQYAWFDEACTFIEENVTDKVETKLMELIDGAYEEKIDVKGNIHTVKLSPNQKAVEFYLSTRGKNRGYNKGIELGDNNIQIVLTPAIQKGSEKIDISGIQKEEGDSSLDA